MGEILRREMLLNIRESAMYLSLSERTISRWVASGKIHAYRYSQKVVRISVDELERLKKSQGARKKGVLSDRNCMD